jgi:hypothetical protein
VGLPASEADNGLIMPLAGHEIGHNVWYAKRMDETIAAMVSKTLVETITSEKNFKDFQSHFGVIDRAQIDDLAGRPHWEPAYAWAMAQCQEMFCDFLGLLLFREAYLHAFAYLLSPGCGVRDPNYPSTRTRATHLLDVAKERKFAVDDDYPDSFDDELCEVKGKEEFLLKMSDAAREALIEQLLLKANESLEGYKQDAHSDDEKRLVHSAFSRATPIAGGVHLMNLVNAVWEIENSGIRIWDSQYPKLKDQPEERSRILNELFLKSLEILEIERIQERVP